MGVDKNYTRHISQPQNREDKDTLESCEEIPVARLNIINRVAAEKLYTGSKEKINNDASTAGSTSNSRKLVDLAEAVKIQD